MPWLAELVESNDSSLDVLPVQCLCEFVLHETKTTPVDVDAEEDNGEGRTGDRERKKPVRKLLFYGFYLKSSTVLKK